VLRQQSQRLAAWAEQPRRGQAARDRSTPKQLQSRTDCDICGGAIRAPVAPEDAAEGGDGETIPSWKHASAFTRINDWPSCAGGAASGPRTHSQVSTVERRVCAARRRAPCKVPGLRRRRGVPRLLLSRCFVTSRIACTQRHQFAAINTALPNPSLKRSTNGRPPGPGLRHLVHHLSPGPGVLPLAPA
jgi:hypothetical protein